MVNVGLVTGVVTPNARQAPRTNVVLPAPTSPGVSEDASCPPSASVSAASWDWKRPRTAGTVEPRLSLPSWATMADGPSSSPGRIALLVKRLAGDRADVPTSLDDLR